jgi:hypothetical protein
MGALSNAPKVTPSGAEIRIKNVDHTKDLPNFIRVTKSVQIIDCVIGILVLLSFYYLQSTNPYLQTNTVHIAELFLFNRK